MSIIVSDACTKNDIFRVIMTIVGDITTWSVTYDHHCDDSRGFIIHATESDVIKRNRYFFVLGFPAVAELETDGKVFGSDVATRRQGRKASSFMHKKNKLERLHLAKCFRPV